MGSLVEELKRREAAARQDGSPRGKLGHAPQIGAVTVLPRQEGKQAARLAASGRARDRLRPGRQRVPGSIGAGRESPVQEHVTRVGREHAVGEDQINVVTGAAILDGAGLREFRAQA
jgi:hypothetical protein